MLDSFCLECRQKSGKQVPDLRNGLRDRTQYDNPKVLVRVCTNIREVKIQRNKDAPFAGSFDGYLRRR